VTERGIARAPYESSLEKLAGAARVTTGT
jgi:hypothetical protein